MEQVRISERAQQADDPTVRAFILVPAPKHRIYLYVLHLIHCLHEGSLEVDLSFLQDKVFDRVVEALED